jgi:hypothetical protein
MCWLDREGGGSTFARSRMRSGYRPIPAACAELYAIAGDGRLRYERVQQSEHVVPDLGLKH